MQQTVLDSQITHTSSHTALGTTSWSSEQCHLEELRGQTTLELLKMKADGMLTVRGRRRALGDTVWR